MSIYCSCGARVDTKAYPIIENCLLTNYPFVKTFITNTDYSLVDLESAASTYTLVQPSIMSVLEAPCPKKEEYDFSEFLPEFPLYPDDDPILTEFMDGCVRAVETWVYTQGFFGVSFYKIPEGIKHIMCETVKSKVGQQLQSCKFPFLQLLINLVGSPMETYLDLQPIPKDPIEKVRYSWLVYKKALMFLEDLGATFTYINPEFMMDFPMYCTYIKHFAPDGAHQEFVNISNEVQYYRLSKQCWLDLLLQTYKVLILFRLMKLQEAAVISSAIIPEPQAKFRKSIKDTTKNSHIFSNNELLLLNWLTFHYNEMRNSIWSENSYLGPRDITYFGQNMDDGFVYTAVTLSYCPYMQPHFKKLVAQPQTYEECMHNNIIVLQSWEMLNFSLTVNLQDLIKQNLVQCLILTAYLFDILPNMYPLERVEFIAGLGSKVVKKVTIKNINSFPVAYKPRLLGNDNKCFEVNSSIYVIPPKEKRNVNITYAAKFLKRSECTLVLSGECRGYRYAKNRVVTLVGQPDISYMTSTINHKAPLHTNHLATFTIKSPYNVKATYDLRVTSEEYSNVNELLSSLEQISDDFELRRIQVGSQLEFDENGIGRLDTIAMCISTLEKSSYIYFRNPEVGDFAIRIISIPENAREVEVLELFVPKSHSSTNIGIKKGLCCAELEIPCQDRILWQSIVNSLVFTKAKEDGKFWKRIAHSQTGLHMLQRLLKIRSKPYTFDVSQPISYKLVPEKGAGIVLPSHVDINDELSSENIKIPIRIKCKENRLRNFCLKLEAEKEYRQRIYRINIIYADEEEEPEEVSV